MLPFSSLWAKVNTRFQLSLNALTLSGTVISALRPHLPRLINRIPGNGLSCHHFPTDILCSATSNCALAWTDKALPEGYFGQSSLYLTRR
ncbi:hypothetical protein BDV39DRAFT_171387 [Aspergillus sergii]|uniref:Uncharacterized protein n=1 Tax=Aspergillus sergii TaxID=1034303 RepID=A0A5N6X992_9EURO|nr:hypothetical protein BDV39DRAFT_171387 [Aspergillus sergii]